VQGQEDPPLGWISRAFDSKRPTTTLRGALAIRGTTTLVTELQVDWITTGARLSARPLGAAQSAGAWA
jgi:hypothetical protein